MTLQESFFWMTLGHFLYFVPSMTVLMLQQCSCRSCFPEIKDKSRANVSMFPSHKNFCGAKQNSLQELYMYSIADHTEETLWHSPRETIILECVQFGQPWCSSSSLLLPPRHAWVSPLSAINWVRSFWQLGNHRKQNPSFTAISCSYIAVDPEDTELED